MKVPKAYYGALVLFCAMTLFVGMASAADGTLPSVHNAGGAGQWHVSSVHHGFDLTNATVQQQILTNLQQKGVDTSGLQAAFQSGNTTAAKEWMQSQFRAQMPGMNGRHPGNGTGHQKFDLTNVTVQQQILTKLQQKGVDTSGLQVAFQNNDTAAAKTWMQNYFESHKPAMTKFSGRQGLDLTNVTVQQQILTKLQQKGVDTSGLQSAFQSGNTTAAKEWMQSQFRTHAVGMNARHHANQTEARQTP
jgi:SOS response regulatory protein OraA/RecX